ncbi:MAG: hypothetical protein K8M05_32230 [Deltaproteobacteria bacterium]|nr:hypothetical protein [Kofleriaceae bacterium]
MKSPLFFVVIASLHLAACDSDPAPKAGGGGAPGATGTVAAAELELGLDEDVPFVDGFRKLWGEMRRVLEADYRAGLDDATAQRHEQAIDRALIDVSFAVGKSDVDADDRKREQYHRVRSRIDSARHAVYGYPGEDDAKRAARRRDNKTATIDGLAGKLAEVDAELAKL